MMMAGAFLGWQPTLIAFFVGVFVALFFGVVQLIRKGDQALAFAPALAVGVMVTVLIWPALGPNVFILFSEAWLLGGVVAVGAVLFLASSFMLRLVRGPEPAGAVEGQEKEAGGGAT